jgi:hypothetical protein
MKSLSPHIAQILAELLANVRIGPETFVSAPQNLGPVRTAPDMPPAERAAVGRKMCAFAAELRGRHGSGEHEAIKISVNTSSGSLRAERWAR